jgi:hypothetical protein
MQVYLDTGNPYDKITKDNTLTVSNGTYQAAPNSTIKLYANNAVIATTVANNKGVFSVTTPVLADGVYALKVTVTPPITGLESAPVQLGTWTIDTVAPDAPVITRIASDTGSSSSDYLTKDNVLTITGSAELHSTLKLYDNDQVIFTLKLTNTSFVIDTPILADGVHHLRITATDVADNESASTDLGIWSIDTQAPAKPAVSSASSDTGSSSGTSSGISDRITSDDTITITGHTEPKATIRVYDKATGVYVLVGRTKADDDGYYSVTTISLEDGDHPLSITSADVAGNESAYLFIGLWRIDTTPPNKPSIETVIDDTGYSATDRLTKDRTLTVIGNTEPRAFVRVYDIITGTRVLVGSGYSNNIGRFSITTVVLNHGRHKFIVTVEDKAGNIGEPSSLSSWSIDTSSPDEPSVSSISSDTSSSSSDHTTGDNTLTVTGYAEPLGIIKIYDKVLNNFVLVGQGRVDQYGYYSVTTQPLSDGTHELNITITDLAGNESKPSKMGKWVIDTHAPANPVISSISSDTGYNSQDAITSDTTIKVRGKAEPFSRVKVWSGYFDPIKIIGRGRANALGDYVVYTEELPNGNHPIYVTSTDKAGNRSDMTYMGNWYIDTSSYSSAVSSSFSSQAGFTYENRVTDDNTLTLVGKSERNSIVRLYTLKFGPRTLVGSGFTDGNGQFRVTTDPLSEGVHHLIAVPEDYAGNQGEITDLGSWRIQTTKSETVAYDLCRINRYEYIGTTLECSLCKAGWPQRDGRISISFYTVPCPYLSTGTESGIISNGWPSPSWFWGFEAVELHLGCIPYKEGTEPTANVWVGRTVRGGGTSSVEILARYEQLDSSHVQIDLDFNILINGVWTPWFDVSTTLSKRPDSINAPCLGKACGLSYASDYVPVSPSAVACQGDLRYIKLVAGTSAWYEGCGYQAEAAPGLAVKPGPVCSFFNGYRMYTCFRALAYSKTDPPEFAPTFTQLGYDKDNCVYTESDYITEQPTPGEPCSCLYGKKEGQNFSVRGSYIRKYFDVGCPGEGPEQFQAVQIGELNPEIPKEIEYAPELLGRWTIDTTPPAAPQVTGISTDTNSASSDRITKESRLTIYGAGESSATIYVYSTFGGSKHVVGKASIPANGLFTVRTETLPDGQHNLSIAVIDKAGNESDSQSLGIWTIDTEAPDAPTVEKVTNDTGNSSDRYTRDNTLTVRGEAEPNTLVRLYILNTITNVFIAVGEALVNADGTYSVTTRVLEDNAYPLSITNIDIAGNESARYSLGTWIIDTRPIILALDVQEDTGSNSLDRVTKDKTLTVTGTAEANTVVRVFVDGLLYGQKTILVSGPYSVTTQEISDGTHSLTVRLFDLSYNPISPVTDLGNWVIDTAKPDKPTFSKISQDTGRIGDKVTKEKVFRVSGTTAPYNIVRLYDKNATNPNIPKAVAKADGDGKYTLTTAPLEDGKKRLVVRSFDLAGNASAERDLGEWLFDSENPENPVVTTVSVDSGRSNADKITNDSQITVTGTCEIGGTPRLYDSVSGDYVLVGTGKTDKNGNYTVTTIPLEDGEHILSLAILDLAGNEGDYYPLDTWIIDTLAPSSPSVSMVEDDTWSISSSNSSDQVTKDNTLIIKGKAEPNAIIKVYNHGVLIKTGLADSQGRYEIALDELVDGTYNLTVTATDVAGNESRRTSLGDWVIDTSEPSSPSLYSVSYDTGSSSSDQKTNDNTLTIIGKAEPLSLIRIYDRFSGQPIKVGQGYANSEGKYSVTTIPLEDGEHPLEATSTDLSGNESAPTSLGIWLIDTRSASISDVSASSDTGSASDDRKTSDNTITITGKAPQGSRVKLFEKIASNYYLIASTYVGSSSKFSITTPPLSDGYHDLFSTVTDKNGNVGPYNSLGRWFIDQSSASSAVISSISSDSGVSSDDKVTSDNTLTVTGKAEPHCLVKVYDLWLGLPELVGSTMSDENGFYSVTTSQLEDGIHELIATVTDPAGNVSSPVFLGVWTIDTEAPNAPTSSSAGSDSGPNDRETTDNTITATGKAEPRSVIKIKDSGVTVGVARATLAGEFSVTTAPLTAGYHTLTITCTDIAGNESLPKSIGVWHIVAFYPTTLADPKVGVDTGRFPSESSDKITSDNTLTVSGDGQIPGRRVKVYVRLVGDTAYQYVGADSVDGGGRYSATTVPLPDGVYDVFLSFSDLVYANGYELIAKDTGDGSICVAIRPAMSNTWEVCSTPVIVKDYSPAILMSDCATIRLYLYALKFPNPDILPELCYSSSGSSDYCSEGEFLCDGQCLYRYSALFDTWVLESGSCVSRLGYTCACQPPPDPSTIAPPPDNGDTYETNCR